MAIPALLSKKLNGRPVMMRISREEETYIGRTRPGLPGVGEDGLQERRPRHRDRCVHRRRQRPVSRARATTRRRPTSRRCSTRRRTRASAGSRWRPTRRRACRSARPAVCRARFCSSRWSTRRPSSSASIRSRFARSTRRSTARSFGLNPVGAGDAAADREGHELVRQGSARSRRAALQLGRAQEAQRPAQRHQGDAASPSATARSPPARSGVDGLFVIKPDGKLYIHQGVGNLGTHSAFDTARVIAEVHGLPVGERRRRLGQHRPGRRVELDPGRQPDDARAHARELRGGHRRQEAAAGTGGGRNGRQSRRLPRRRRGRRRTGRLADLGAGWPSAPSSAAASSTATSAGRHQRHDQGCASRRSPARASSRPRATPTRATARPTASSPASPKSKSTSRPASTTIVDYVAVADVGTVINPRSLERADSRRRHPGHVRTSMSQKLVYDAHYGVAIGKRMYHNKPPTMLDIPIDARAEGAEHSRSGQPGRRRQGHRRAGHRRRRLGGACARWPTPSATTTS